MTNDLTSNFNQLASFGLQKGHCIISCYMHASMFALSHHFDIRPRQNYLLGKILGHGSHSPPSSLTLISVFCTVSQKSLIVLRYSYGLYLLRAFFFLAHYPLHNAKSLPAASQFKSSTPFYRCSLSPSSMSTLFLM